MHYQQKRTIAVLIILGIAYFVAFIFPNQNGAETERMLAMNSQDESFQYPFLMHMVTPGKDAQETRWRLISYGHYIYGYPFYVASALTILPLRWIYGAALPDQIQTTLLVLRQVVSVLPIILAAFLLVYLVTRFRSTLLSIFIFLFLLTIPGVVRQNIWWWHPDALSILSVMLTFLFLDRDQLRFGRNFFFAAILSGMATSIKSVGVFFAAAIAGYLLAGVFQKRIKFTKASVVGILFIVVMFSTFLLTNPLLFFPAQRERIIQVRIEHNYFFTHGWLDSDPYATGLTAWLPILKGWYGGIPFLLFSLVSLAVASFSKNHKTIARLFLAWIIPLSLYLIYFIAVKPDHYWLPVMIPLFTGGFMLIPLLIEKIKDSKGLNPFLFWGLRLGLLVVILIITIQFIFQVQVDWPLFMRAINPI